MADGMTVQKADDLLALVQGTASVDVKVQHVTAAKTDIKHCNVPEQCIAPLFEALRLAATNAHNLLANAGFTTINHLITRLSMQDPRYLAKEARHTLPLIVDRLGDQKERVRALAAQALTTMYPHASVDVEHFIKNTAMTGKSTRAKEASMRWVHQMHDDQGMQFKAYVPALMKLLEDADAGVRDVAKATVIGLFRDAPGPAKSDLKKQLKNLKVRPAIESAIIKEIGPGTASAATGPRSHTPVEPPPPSQSSSRSINLSASMSSLGSERPVTPGLDTRMEPADLVFVNTSRELDDIFREMEDYFEGRETEHNWLKREKSIRKLRGLIAGNGAIDYHDQFVLGLRALLDGIIKAVTSLRTSLSKEGCALVQEMALSLGPSMDPMVELLMQTFIKLSASTKKISAAMANATVDAIIGQVTYTNHIMQHITSTIEDKNVQPRLFVAGWLATLMKKEAGHKGYLEHTGGVSMIEKSIKKGLSDSHPGVRKKMGSLYWLFAGLWPARAETLMENLDAQAQKLLITDPNNPNATKNEPVAQPGLGFSKSTTASTSLRETMRAQRQARKVPPRPASAISHASVPTISHAASAHASTTHAPFHAFTTHAPTHATAPTHTSTSSSTARAKPEHAGGMSGAPMRARRRPEVPVRPDVAPARPATAGPYSVRSQDWEQHVDEDDNNMNNVQSAHRAQPSATPKPVESSPRRAAPRTRPGHAPTLSEGSAGGSPARAKTSEHVTSPLASPKLQTPRLKGSRPAEWPTGSSGSNEELTLLVPTIPGPATSQITETLQMEDASWRPERRPSPKLVISEHHDSVPVDEDAHMAESTTPTVEEAPAVAIAAAAALAAPEMAAPLREMPGTGSVDHGQAQSRLEPRSLTPEDTPMQMQVYEDPEPENQGGQAPTAAVALSSSSQPQQPQQPPVAVLEVKSVNENAGNAGRPPAELAAAGDALSPEKAKQNARLLESGITKIHAKTLDVHSFRKLQSLIRDDKVSYTDAKFDAMVVGLFGYLEDPLSELRPAKVLDVKTQILATIRVLLRKDRSSFQPHIAAGLNAILTTRSACPSRAHIVGGLELLAGELVALGDASDMIMTLTSRLDQCSDMTPEGCRVLSLGIFMLRAVLERRDAVGGGGGVAYAPSDIEVDRLAELARRGIESSDSGVRRDSVELCVALHTILGESRFWDALRNAREDPKNLITYYIARQRQENGALGA